MISSLCFLLFILLPIHSSSLPLSDPFPIDSPSSPSSDPLPTPSSSPPLSDPLAVVSPETICSYTHFPLFCKTMLPTTVSSVQEYSLKSLEHSLTTTNNFLSSILTYLDLPSTLSEPTIRALQDCQLLATSTKDLLTYTHQILTVKQTLQTIEAENLHTYLSTTLTNHETCSDGLKETIIASSILDTTPILSSELLNCKMSYSVSLAIYLQGWGNYGVQGRGLRENRSRKLLEAYNNNVKVKQRVVVNAYGGGDFTTINEAVAAAPVNSGVDDGYFVIYIVAGVYEEYITIGNKQNYIMMVGDGINQTIITGNRNVEDGSTTFSSATFAVTGEGFVAKNITFRNTAGAIKHQAVAVRNGADLSTFYSCSFEGYQDTLYAHSQRQFYKDCDIYGTIDFIFGNAAVVLQSCNIYARLPLSTQFNAITAQGRTDSNQNTGTSLHNCNIKAASDLESSIGTVKTYLGRPWKEYSRTVYMQSGMDYLIDPAGWIAWDGEFGLSTLYYGEYANTGAGSGTINRVKWSGYRVMDANDAGKFTVSSFIQGDNWLPTSLVPYTGGLN